MMDGHRINTTAQSVSAPLPTQSKMTPSRWSAQLQLGLTKTARGSRLVKNNHVGPLYVQKPFYVEGDDLPHIYLLHPPGGLVSGDDLSINIELGENTRGLFTAPGAGRIYRARPDRALQQQTTQLHLSHGSSLEWLPQECIFYPDSFGKLKTQVFLPENAEISGFIGWEISCFGLSQSTAPFLRGHIDQGFEIWRGDIPEFIERQKFNGDNLLVKFGRAGFQQKTVSGLMVAGPFPIGFAVHNLCLEQIRDIQSPDSVLFASTQRGRWLVTRYLGGNAEQARKLFTQVWRIIRPNLLGREVVEPRIWAC
ncbi:urease accessory protein UreD [Sessilibacter sp. MAH4]